LQYEWINSRGAIARFDRNTVEIRLIDVQECPLADFAVASAVIAALRLLTSEKVSAFNTQSGLPVEPLAAILGRCIRDAENAIIDDSNYLRALGVHRGESLSAGELWSHLLEKASTEFPADSARKPLELILTQGSLSTRILKALRGSGARAAIVDVYRELADCLAEGRLFVP
jgi:hypothetical protein